MLSTASYIPLHDGRYTPLPETELYANVFSRIYDQTIAIDQDPTDSHRLAVLYMVFALGTLMDLDQPYLSTQSTQYYQLARAALSLDSVLENQSIPAIQALVRPRCACSDDHGCLLITLINSFLCAILCSCPSGMAPDGL